MPANVSCTMQSTRGCWRGQRPYPRANHKRAWPAIPTALWLSAKGPQEASPFYFAPWRVSFSERNFPSGDRSLFEQSLKQEVQVMPAEFILYEVRGGARKAKELMFTAGSIDANEAHRLGMVNRVVPLAELDEASLALATQIAAMQSVFDIHQLGHVSALAQTGRSMLSSLPGVKEKNRESGSGGGEKNLSHGYC
jgi:hypothetical protein